MKSMTNATPVENQSSDREKQEYINQGSSDITDRGANESGIDYEATIRNSKKDVSDIISGQPISPKDTALKEVLAELRSFKHFEFDEYANVISETGNVDSLNNLGDNAFKAISDSCVLIGMRKNADESIIKGIISKVMKKVVRIMHIKILIQLYECGADVNHRNKNRGVTALDVAVNFNDIGMAKFLLSVGANPNLEVGAGNIAIGRGGNSPLMVAAMNGNAKMVGLLIKYGADVNFINSNLETVYKMAQPGIRKILKKAKSFDDSKPWLQE